MTHILLIDNYDSFTWNIYQYLRQSPHGDTVTVARNDELSLDQISQLDPDLIFISPGPGHPSTDAGISKAAIEHFQGKIPIVGVCMGLQCMFEVYGGTVESAGEIVHGKTTTIHHDGKGMFENVPQSVAVTRYHSLAGVVGTVPDCLEVTATTETEPPVIMGVRHKKYAIEGVQFHPESILTEAGQVMIDNVVRMACRTGASDSGASTASGANSSSANSSSADSSKDGSNARGNSDETGASARDARPDSSGILHKIYSHRKLQYASTTTTPGKSLQDLQDYYDAGIAPPPLNFYSHLQSAKAKGNVIIGEFKRASPSKGDINIDLLVAQQAAVYAHACAAVLVLTEPHWFKGSLDDMMMMKRLLDVKTGPKRPAVLRKDFIFSRYQILEARLYGADTVLLIVKMLSDTELKDLYDYSLSLGMVPLVEVNTEEELDRAIHLGPEPKVIGVNNRNLVNFNVDLNTTSKMVGKIEGEVFLLALSGISGPEDIAKYKAEGVDGFLVGESLMRGGKKLLEEMIMA